jgi:hypothetical protein
MCHPSHAGDRLIQQAQCAARDQFAENAYVASQENIGTFLVTDDVLRLDSPSGALANISNFAFDSAI